LLLAAALLVARSDVDRFVWVLRCCNSSSAELCLLPQYPSLPFIQLQMYGPLLAVDVGADAVEVVSVVVAAAAAAAVDTRLCNF
jgi:hypothetical protein